MKVIECVDCGETVYKKMTKDSEYGWICYSCLKKRGGYSKASRGERAEPSSASAFAEGKSKQGDGDKK
jgi:hypothetical protein